MSLTKDRRRRPFRINDLSVAANVPRCAGVDLDYNVCVWNLENGAKVTAFPVEFSSGGRRIALSGDGQYCAAAQWGEGGVGAYDVTSGALLWRRRDLHDVQRLKFDAFGHRWIACRDEGGCHFLDIVSGKSELVLRGARDCYVNPYDGAMLICKSSRLPLELWSAGAEKQIAKVDRLSPSVLDAGFAPGVLALAEMNVATELPERDQHGNRLFHYKPPDGGPVRLISMKDGMVLWKYSPGYGRHLIAVACESQGGRAFGIVRFEEKHEVVQQLICIDMKLGVAFWQFPLPPSVSTIFDIHGRVLVVSSGDVFALTGSEPCLKMHLECPEIAS
jgi:hypothetical protein